MRVADLIWEIVKKEVDTIYMVSGGGAMFLVDALGRSGLRYVPTIHEQGAGYMAIGHAMATNSLGVCLVTSGPGSTNILTAVAAAWMDSIPLLIISGQAKQSTLIGDSGLRTRGIQEIDIIPMVEPITKWANQLKMQQVEVLSGILEQTVATCRDGRPGPCWLSVPLDVQGMEVK